MIILRVIKVFTSCISVEKNLFKQIVTGDTVFPQFIILVKKLLYLCTVGFVTKHLLNLHCWDELKNFAANNLL